MAISVGDYVHVTSFGKGTVREVRNGQRYLVEVKGRAMVVEAAQVTRLEGPGPAAPARATVAEASAGRAAHTAQASIDLHGMTADEAIAAVDAFLNDAMLSGHEQVQVIHGRSGGRLKAVVHRRLKELPSVRGFRVDPRNLGVTIVNL